MFPTALNFWGSVRSQTWAYKPDVSGLPSFYCAKAAIVALLGVLSLLAKPSQAMPPPEEVPEEVLRSEIILEARSPLDGQPLTAAEYAELQAQLAAEDGLDLPLSPDIREAVLLLNLRRILLRLVPF